MAELLVATGLFKSYGRTALLSGVDLCVREGELLLIQGANGAGKTTLLRLLAGREKPDRGRILSGGHLMGINRGGLNLLPTRTPYLVVRSPQSSRTFSSLTVAECFRLVGGDHGGPFRTLFEAYLDRAAGTLSGGRRKTLSAALSLMTGAPVVLLDEPEAGLDPGSVDLLSKMISAAKDAGRAFIVCAHQPSQKIWSLADRACWLYEGRLYPKPPALAQQSPQSKQDLPVHAEYEEHAPPASLQVSDVRINRGGMRVLKNVSFDLQAGQFLSVSGPNGSGKSSLALALMGLIETEGEILLDGVRVDRLSPYRRSELGMSYMPQAPRGLFYDLSVEENLLSVARRVRAETPNLSQTWEEFPELYSSRNQLARRLSGGLQRLLALAMSLRQAPRLLILDEPLAGLSGGLARRVLNSLATLTGQATVLMFEHRAEEISAAGLQHIGLSDLCSLEGG